MFTRESGSVGQVGHPKPDPVRQDPAFCVTFCSAPVRLCAGEVVVCLPPGGAHLMTVNQPAVRSLSNMMTGTEEPSGPPEPSGNSDGVMDVRFAQLPPHGHHGQQQPPAHMPQPLSQVGGASASTMDSSVMPGPHQQSQPQAPMGSHHHQQQPGMGDSVVSGVVGFEIINEMFQRQARRLETQLQNQENDRKAVEHTQAQLLVMQAQLQWHAAHYQERTEQVTKSSETIARMQSYVGTMESEHTRAVSTAQHLARDVAALRDQLGHEQPTKLATLSTTLSEIASHGADLSTLDGIGALFAEAGQHRSGSQGAERKGGGGASASSQLGARVEQGPISGSNSYQSGESSGDSPPLNEGDHKREGGSSSASASGVRSGSGSHGERDTNSYENSSSDSADALSAALTWPKAIAARRGDRHSKDVASGHSNRAMQAANDSGDSGHSSGRQDSPPENEGSSSSDSDKRGSTTAERPPSRSSGSSGTGAAATSSLSLAAIAADHGCPTASAGEMRQGLVDPASLHGLQQGGSEAQAALRPGAPASLPLTGLPGSIPTFAPAPVLQGVLPFPGQGVVDVQQGVVSGTSSLEAFRDIDLSAAGYRQQPQPAMLQGVLEQQQQQQQQQADLEQRRSSAEAPQQKWQPPRNADGTEPPAKRAAGAATSELIFADATLDSPRQAQHLEAESGATVMDTD